MHTTEMFKNVVQPDIFSLFSSTGSEPLGLFSAHTDASLKSDSFYCLLKDDTSMPLPDPPATLVVAPALRHRDDVEESGYTLSQTVLHIQSPTLRRAFIQAPPVGDHNKYLGLKHPWIHLQVRNIGREWSFEVGVVDNLGQEGIVRCSTFQVTRNLNYRIFSCPVFSLR